MAEKTPTYQIQAFGNYFLLERIAVGGMAEIFKAKQVGVRGFEKIVVIKKILSHLSEDPEFVEMFEDEARIAAQLSQANIVQIYELGEIEGTLYITMEFVDGKNMRDLTKALSLKHIHLSVEQVLFMMIEVLKGLDYAHRKADSKGMALELVHRDMSPQNIILSYEGEVKILDFGIAKAASKISKTEAGVLKGKFSYMSPEQASGKHIDQRTDIYACGVIAHELLTSERLFRAKSDTETLDRVKEGLVEPPSKKNPLIPPELDDIILKALAKQPHERYQTAGDFLNDLSKISLSMAYNYSSKEMSAFLKTIFASSIDDERRRLNEALARLPEKVLSPAVNLKTRIAFKADNPKATDPSPSNPGHRNEITASIVRRSTIMPLILKTLKRSAIILAGLTLVLALVFFVWKPSASLRSPFRSGTKNPSPSQANDKMSNGKMGEALHIVPIPKPADKPQDSKIQNLFDALKPEPPPETPPKMPNPPTTTGDRDTRAAKFPVPQARGDSAPKISRGPFTKPRLENPPNKDLHANPSEDMKSVINMVAPPEGYADLVIDGMLIGTVPGPKARGIEVNSGAHTIECRAPNRLYKGQISIDGGENSTIRCQDLQ